MKKNFQIETVEKFNHEIKADTDHAQLLIYIDQNAEMLEEATQIIEEMDVHIIEKKSLSSHWILIKLDVKDMRGIAFRLVENGFSNIKGINAIDPKICDFS